VTEVLAEDPHASLREVGRRAGVAPSTVRSVRMRLERRENPGAPPTQPEASQNQDGARNGTRGTPHKGLDEIVPTDATLLVRLRRDPSLRYHEHGRWLLRLLQNNTVRTEDWPEIVAGIPAHCSAQVEQLARRYSQMWFDLAQELNQRVGAAETLGEQEDLAYRRD
jgi:hypothetical protein